MQSVYSTAPTNWAKNKGEQVSSCLSESQWNVNRLIQDFFSFFFDDKRYSRTNAVHVEFSPPPLPNKSSILYLVDKFCDTECSQPKFAISINRRSPWWCFWKFNSLTKKISKLFLQTVLSTINIFRVIKKLNYFKCYVTEKFVNDWMKHWSTNLINFISLTWVKTEVRKSFLATKKDNIRV